MSQLNRIVLTAVAALTAAFLSSSNVGASMIGPVDLGSAGNFTMLALTGGIDDSGPLTGANTVNGPVGVASAGQKFSASGSVKYTGPIYLHTGDTFQSSAPGVPAPQMSAAIDSMLAQAKADAFAASNFASGLAATASYGTINNTMSITENSAGTYVFNINTISFSGGKTLTLDAPSGSNYILNVSGAITLSPGSILLAGGLTSDHVLINYTGTKDIQFSGGGNSSKVFGTLLAPNVTVGLHPGEIVGSLIAGGITMSSGAVVVPEVMPSSVIFGFIGFVVAFGSRRTMMARMRPVLAQGKGQVS
jgi:choice-of-anchor A domain-containing protein